MNSSNSKLLLAVLTLSAAILAVPVVAGGPSRTAGRSSIGHLYLVQKDYTDPNWPVIPGAWGKMLYRKSGTSFAYLFNGHELDPRVAYVLIYYPEPWPGHGLIVLSEPQVPDANGNLHLRNVVDTGDLPADYDDNYPDGAKIWLVPAADVDMDALMMRAWNPGMYLFEYDLISFDDVDDN